MKEESAEKGLSLEGDNYSESNPPSTVKKYKEDRYIVEKKHIKVVKTRKKYDDGEQTYDSYLSESVFGEEDTENSIRQYTLAKSFTKKENENKRFRLKTLRNDNIKPFRKYTVLGWKDNYYTNLLDWSFDNFICAGFGTDLFMYNMAIDDDLESSLYRKFPIPMNGEFLTSLKCNPINPQVSLGYSNGSMKIYDYVKEKSVYNGFHHLLRIAAI